MASIGIGVIGAGIMGADHAQNIHRLIAGADVVAIADPDKGRAEAAIAGIPGALFAVPLAAFVNVVAVYLSRKQGDAPRPEDFIWSTVPRTRKKIS